MQEGLGRERWAHTANICALIANANRDPKKSRAFTSDDFNPFVERADREGVIEVTKDTIGKMREAFTGKRENKNGSREGGDLRPSGKNHGG